MHIAIDARIINSTTGRYIERLLYYLQDIDTANRYTILVREKDKTYWTPRNGNFTVIVAEFDNYSFEEQFGFKKFLSNLAPDLVHFCMPQQPILYHGTHVTTVHDLTLLQTYNSDKNLFIYHTKQLVGRFVFKYIGKTSQHIITPTNYTKEGYMKFARIPEKKISVTYESADKVTDNPSIPYTLPFQEFIIYVGQQSDYKNIKRLGDAHQKLLQNHPNLGLILVGKESASSERNKQYFAKKQYKNILFTGFVSNEELAWLYENTKAYVFPSLMEGFGLPGLEAMVYGAPVVSSFATCLPEVYSEGAYYFDPRDTNDMTRAIQDVLTNPDLRNSLTVKGKQQVEKYSWRRMAEQTHAIYLQALTKTS